MTNSDKAALQIKYLKAKRKLLKAKEKFSQEKSEDADAVLQIAKAEFEQAFDRWHDAEGEESNWSDSFQEEVDGIFAEVETQRLWSLLKRWNAETKQGLSDEQLEEIGIAVIPRLYPEKTEPKA